jgi:hypothetical protein
MSPLRCHREQVREARLEQESIDGGAVASGNDAVADCKT